MTVSRTSSEPALSNIEFQNAQKNIVAALGFIRKSSLKETNNDFQDLLNLIKERIKNTKSVRLVDDDAISFQKNKDDIYTLLVPKKIASQNSYFVYHSLLNYFLDKAKKQDQNKFGNYELNDFLNALTTNSPETQKGTPGEISFEDMVLQVLHEGPSPKPSSELPPLVDSSYVDLTGGAKPNFDLKIVARIIGIYPDEKNELVYWRPFADELHRAVLTNRKEDITNILTSVLNAFLFILTRNPEKKLKRKTEESQDDYNKRIIEKIEKDFFKFIIKFINIRESGNASLRTLFIQAITGIKSEELDSPLGNMDFTNLVDKFSRASISPEDAEIDQRNLLEKEDKKLLMAPRIAQSSTIGAALLGITDQSGSQRSSAVALIGGSQASDSIEKKDTLEIDMNFLELRNAYGFNFADLKEGIKNSLKSAIEANAPDLKEFLPIEIDNYLDIALNRTNDPKQISHFANEGIELLKVFVIILESNELKELLKRNKIQLSPTQFFLSQIFLKYFSQNSDNRKEFYLPILRKLEQQYAEFNGITALINEANEESTRNAQKGKRQETEILVGRIITGRKTERQHHLASLNQGAEELFTGDEIKKYIQSQGISDFIERLIEYSRNLQTNKILIDNNLEEYKLDFIELITGIKPLNNLNTSGRIYGTKVPVLIGPVVKLIEKKELIDLVKAITTRKLMRAVHADTKGEELAKLLPGVDNVPEIAASLYEFLSSRLDLVDIGTAWSDQESTKVEKLSQELILACQQTKKYTQDQTVQITKERERKLEEAANSSKNAQEEIRELQTRVDTLTETLLEVLKMLAAQNRPSADELERLRVRVESGSRATGS